MEHSSIVSDFFPNLFPINMIGKKINIMPVLKDYVDKQGNQQICIRLYQNGIPPQYSPVHLKTNKKHWNKKKGRCIDTEPFYTDYNLLIEKKLAQINSIEIAYRLSNQQLSVIQLKKELNSSTSRIDYVEFYKEYLEIERNTLEKSTYKQQLSSLRKLKKYTSTLLFADITEEWLKKFKGYLKKELKNQDSTISTWLKNFKKYLGKARDHGIMAPLKPEDIAVKKYESNRVFLNKEDINKLHSYYESPFISEKHTEIINHFLFCCYTGIRLGDFWKITQDNFVNDSLVIWNSKSNKPQTIRLNSNAKKFVKHPKFFLRSHTEQGVNRALKDIAKQLSIDKHLHFHVSRHTFAMQYLLNGGQLQHLQRLLGHSKVETTMIYVHIVEDLQNDEIMALDKITEKNTKTYSGMHVIK